MLVELRIKNTVYPLDVSIEGQCLRIESALGYVTSIPVGSGRPVEPPKPKEADLSLVVQALETLLIPLITEESMAVAKEQMGEQAVLDATRLLLNRHKKATPPPKATPEETLFDILNRRFR